jgi:hypothetical protein
MENNGVTFGVDMAVFEANRRKVDPESLRPYMGKHIAWSGDASRVVASGDSYEDLFAKLDALGIPLNTIVHDYVEDTAQL